jgi:putative FmdB family regulatory protein
MPLYEYQCKECGSAFEKMVRLTQAGERPSCPNCGSGQTQKQISNFGARLSGQPVSASSSNCSSSGSPFR